jgi:hypothetical protein
MSVFAKPLNEEFVLALVCIVGKVAYVSDVLNVCNLETKKLEIAMYGISHQIGLGMACMGIGIDRRATDIHPNLTGFEWYERFLSSGEGIVDLKCHELKIRFSAVQPRQIAIKAGKL